MRKNQMLICWLALSLSLATGHADAAGNGGGPGGRGGSSTMGGGGSSMMNSMRQMGGMSGFAPGQAQNGDGAGPPGQAPAATSPATSPATPAG